jgi:hypothetical protein
VEFAYWVGGGDRLAVADVRRELTELTFRTRRSEPDGARIRFPEARYSGRPDAGRRPAKRTYWTLSGPVLLTVWAPA